MLAAEVPIAGGGFVPRTANPSRQTSSSTAARLEVQDPNKYKHQLDKTGNHTVQCRVGMEERLGESESGQNGFKREKEKADHWVAGHVEEGDLSAAF